MAIVTSSLLDVAQLAVLDAAAGKDVADLPRFLRTVPEAGSVVELVGASASGKTEALMAVAVQAAMPVAFGRHWVGGRGVQQVVYVDLDFKLSVLRLAHVLERAVRRAIKRDTDDDVEDAVRKVVAQSLARIRIVRCSEWRQVIDLVEGMATTAASVPSSTLLIFDAISFSHWRDRLLGESRMAQSVNERHLVGVLRSLLKASRNTAIVVSKAALYYNGSATSTSGLFKEFMSPSWSGFVTQRYVLATNAASQIRVVQTHPPPPSAAMGTWTITIGPDGILSVPANKPAFPSSRPS